MKCNKCKNSVGLTALGNCKSCGATIPCMSDKLCSQCSVRQNKCAGCAQPLSGNGSGSGSGK